MIQKSKKNKISFKYSLLRIWLEPRETVREILNYRPGFGVWILILVSSFIQSLHPSYTYGFMKWLPLFNAFCVAVTIEMAYNIIEFWTDSLVGYLLGRALGGKGSFLDVYTANAWAFPPFIVCSIFLRLMRIPTWLKMLSGVDPLPVDRGLWWQILFLLVCSVSVVWGIILVIVNFSEANKFSIGKSILVNAVLFVPSIILIYAVHKAFPFLFLLFK